MPRQRSYRELIAWQKAMALANAIYRATKTWPGDERFGLAAQTKRAAVSIPTNIAEGQGRLGPAEFRHHLSIAHGSLCEVETLLQIAIDNNIMDTISFNQLQEQATEVGLLIRGLLRSLPLERERR